MTPGQTLVEFDGVSKVYRLGRERANVRQAVPGSFGERVTGDKHIAVNDISLKLRERESLGIVGRNGAGKSTLLKLVANVIAPTRGTVRVHGRTAALIELGTGFHPDLTGRENISFGAAVLGMSRKRLRSRIDDVIDFADIGDYVDTPVKRYSSGMMARLGFAVAAHLDAEVVVLDEVLSVGDSRFQRRCHDRIGELRRSGVALLYVTHAMWSVPVVCTRAMLLSSGNLVIEGDVVDVLTAYEQLTIEEQMIQGGRCVVEGVEIEPTEAMPNRPLRISATIQTHEPMPGAYLLVSFHTLDNTVITGVDFVPRALSQTGRFRIDCLIDDLPLQPGTYAVFVTVAASYSQPVVETQVRVEMTIKGDLLSPDIYGRTSLLANWRES